MSFPTAVSAPFVPNQPMPNRGPSTSVFLLDTTDATSGSVSFSLPNDTGGPLDVIVSGKSATNGGSETWRGKVVVIGSTVTVTKAFAAVDTWDSTAGASTWTVVVSQSGSLVTVTCTGSAGQGHIGWTVALQYVSAA